MDKKPVDFANKILMSLGEPFLTAEESITIPKDASDLKGIFQALFKIMQNRKSPQTAMDRLRAMAILNKVEITPEDALKKFGSNILLGFGVDA